MESLGAAHFPATEYAVALFRASLETLFAVQQSALKVSPQASARVLQSQTRFLPPVEPVVLERPFMLAPHI
ncbi:hypothetical protein LCI18_006259 [Fusarium solani-melongenae]|uniref:Uncharacterized protein n=1 Tax=Fusarium solani subsp. cucurbitae TaxID=2747967 RepID=A0ACD3Z281_FUSSC|nr:hypothetical protein LCI18_006259 [Fusarium solani-melongenae]